MSLELSLTTVSISSTEKEDLGNAKPSQLAQLDALLTRLPTLGNRDLIDSAAVEFSYLNSKVARKRLVKVQFFSILTLSRYRLANSYVGYSKCASSTS